MIDVGGARALAVSLEPDAQNEPVNAVMAVGHIASFSARLVAALTAEGIDGILVDIICTSKQVATLEAAAWAVGQIGKHTPQITSGIIQKSVIDALYETYTAPKGDELRAKAKQALKLIIGQAADIAEIRPYITRTQFTVQRYILQRIAQIIATNYAMKDAFINSGGIEEIAALGPPADLDEKTRTVVEEINQLVPLEPQQ
jgi:hypothetical protein